MSDTAREYTPGVRLSDLRMLVLVLAATACRSEPAPTKVEDPSALVSAPTREKVETPFIDPEKEPPPPRTDAQLDPAAVTAAIDDANAAIAKGDVSHALARLQRCINKVPANPTCEGLYAATLLEERKQRVWARHFLHEAVTSADAAMPDDLLRRLGRLAGQNARFADAALAFELLVSRGTATADDYIELAHALQADKAREPQAIEMLEKAYALVPTRHDLLLELAVLTANTDRKAAIVLFEKYKKVMADDPRQVEIAENRLATLRREVGDAAKPPI